MKNNKAILLKTIDYIEVNLYESITLDDIAKSVGYSKYHLNRMFAEGTGQTIYKYIQGRRLSESAKKLITSSENILEIALDSGYTTQQSYTLAFRQLYQCTPKVYRELYQVHLRQYSIKRNSIIQHKGSCKVFLAHMEVLAA